MRVQVASVSHRQLPVQRDHTARIRVNIALTHFAATSSLALAGGHPTLLVPPWADRGTGQKESHQGH